MAVVLDSPAPIGVALQNPRAVDLVGSAIESGICYMTIACVEDFARLVAVKAGGRLADQWIEWLYSSNPIRIVESSDPEYLSERFVRLVAEVGERSELITPGATAAALASTLGIPVVTDRAEFAELERTGFCSVIWL